MGMDTGVAPKRSRLRDRLPEALISRPLKSSSLVTRFLDIRLDGAEVNMVNTLTSENSSGSYLVYKSHKTRLDVSAEVKPTGRPATEVMGNTPGW